MHSIHKTTKCKAPAEGYMLIYWKCANQDTTELSPDDDVMQFPFERIAGQQEWPIEILVTQLASLSTGKTMATTCIIGTGIQTLENSLQQKQKHQI